MLNQKSSIKSIFKMIATSQSSNQAPLHIPVMKDQIIKYLVDDTKHFKTYLDLTFGAGGHTKSILDKNPNAIVYASDRDPFSYELAKEMSKIYNGRLIPLNCKFSDLDKALEQASVEINSIDAALIDCGCSSIQLDRADRGFSLSKDGPLDMRMGSINEQTISAEDVINKLDEDSLDRIIFKYGEESLHRKIAHGIVYFRNAHGPIKTTKQLADLINTVVKGYHRTDSLSRPSHVATKTFQAIRIFVNNELNELYNGINQVYNYLKPKSGRLAVISFHSLEDRIVKSHFNDVEIKEEENEYEKGKISSKKKKHIDRFKMNETISNEIYENRIKRLWLPLNDRKVILPSKQEVESNPRARSAKLRVAVKN